MTLKQALVEIFKDEELKNNITKHPRILHYLNMYFVCLAVTTFMTIGYVEIGHDKAWPRADRWYTCLHTHHHFPWQ